MKYSCDNFTYLLIDFFLYSFTCTSFVKEKIATLCQSPRCSYLESLISTLLFLDNRPFRPTILQRPKLIISILSQSAKQSFDSLSSIADLITPKSENPPDFLKECRSGAFSGLRAAYRTFNSVKITGRIEGEVCEELGKTGLKFLSHNGG